MTERKPNQCVDCGKPVSRRATRCQSCNRNCEETRRKLSRGVKAAWKRGTYDSEETRRKMSESTKASYAHGDFASEETRQRRSRAAKASHARGDFDSVDRKEVGRKVSKCVIAAWRRGCYDSEKTRQRKSKAAKASWKSGDYDSEETHHRKSKSTKAAHARGDYDSEEYRHKRSEIIKAARARGAYSSEETRRKRSESMAAAWRRGDFDGVFQSPTKPELTVMTVLDLLGVPYEFNQFRIESYIYDFYLPEHQTLIEYDGYYWHTRPGRKERDAIKDKLAKEAGFRLIRLRALQKQDLAGPEIWARLHSEIIQGGISNVISTKREYNSNRKNDD